MGNYLFLVFFFLPEVLTLGPCILPHEPLNQTFCIGYFKDESVA
jgi:hypothetical protein